MNEEKVDTDRILSYAKKLYVINLLGGCCSNCGETAPWKLELHHTRDKEKLVKFDGRLSKILKEAEKCILLCSNCHREHHYDKNSTTKGSIIKGRILNYKGTSACECCGYDKNISALDFHHKNPLDKCFNMSIIGKKISQSKNKELQQRIKDEADKCLLLCSNCHKEVHFDLDYYNSHLHLIQEKSRNLKETQPELDKEEVKRLYESGMRQIDIAKKYNASKGTISGILKTFGLTTEMKDIMTDREEFKRYVLEGHTCKEIQLYFNISGSVVIRTCQKLKIDFVRVYNNQKIHNS